MVTEDYEPPCGCCESIPSAHNCWAISPVLPILFLTDLQELHSSLLNSVLHTLISFSWPWFPFLFSICVVEERNTEKRLMVYILGWLLPFLHKGDTLRDILSDFLFLNRRHGWLEEQFKQQVSMTTITILLGDCDVLNEVVGYSKRKWLWQWTMLSSCNCCWSSLIILTGQEENCQLSLKETLLTIRGFTLPVTQNSTPMIFVCLFFLSVCFSFP